MATVKMKTIEFPSKTYGITNSADWGDRVNQLLLLFCFLILYYKLFLSGLFENSA